MNKNIEQENEEQEEEKQRKKTQAKTITLSEEEYKQLKQEVGQARQQEEKVLRIQADFENSRKRLEREKQEFIRFANEGLITNLLNVVDDLERTLELAQDKREDFSAFLKGVEMILAHLYDLLKKQGLVPMESKGKIFNPSFHEALLKAETDDFPENTIVEELQKGYLLNDRVIRTAKVKVAKRPEIREQKSEDRVRKPEDDEQPADTKKEKE